MYCELPRVPGDPRESGSLAYSCADDPSPAPDVYGYCHIDPLQGVGSPILVQGSPPQNRPRFKMAPANLARPDSAMLVVYVQQRLRVTRMRCESLVTHCRA
jgi:hypothetical protein